MRSGPLIARVLFATAVLALVPAPMLHAASTLVHHCSGEFCLCTEICRTDPARSHPKAHSPGHEDADSASGHAGGHAGGGDAAVAGHRAGQAGDTGAATALEDCQGVPSCSMSPLAGTMAPAVQGLAVLVTGTAVVVAGSSSRGVRPRRATLVDAGARPDPPPPRA